MQPYHYRMAELWTYHQTRELTTTEQNELSICLQANALFARKLGDLHNYTYAASIVGDQAWQQELGLRIEKMEKEFAIQLTDLKKYIQTESS
ncbi:DUF7667 family protein [Paenibacillus cremeus]|uniref:Uncharacterized protein n=1 Tax=Paenibacillus cremeus TaxID=2163881 RepID=A0A559JMC5_9BACL|nr:hypothetical protein [Paenibacillus cremeus]TVY01016.1 hypothetical protein FPZ49_32705 [Paenibacillus cremeus]